MWVTFPDVSGHIKSQNTSSIHKLKLSSPQILISVWSQVEKNLLPSPSGTCLKQTVGRGRRVWLCFTSCVSLVARPPALRGLVWGMEEGKEVKGEASSLLNCLVLSGPGVTVHHFSPTGLIRGSSVGLSWWGDAFCPSGCCSPHSIHCSL